MRSSSAARVVGRSCRLGQASGAAAATAHPDHLPRAWLGAGGPGSSAIHRMQALLGPLRGVGRHETCPTVPVRSDARPRRHSPALRSPADGAVFDRLADRASVVGAAVPSSAAACLARSASTIWSVSGRQAQLGLTARVRGCQSSIGIASLGGSSSRGQPGRPGAPQEARAGLSGRRSVPARSRSPDLRKAALIG